MPCRVGCAHGRALRPCLCVTRTEHFKKLPRRLGSDPSVRTGLRDGLGIRSLKKHPFRPIGQGRATGTPWEGRAEAPPSAGSALCSRLPGEALSPLLSRDHCGESERRFIRSPGAGTTGIGSVDTEHSCEEPN